MTSEYSPRTIFLLSGKRKSGKDYIADRLHSRLIDVGSTIIRLAGPIKHHFAVSRNLDYDEMFSSSAYKERFRKEMVTWSDEVRNKDTSFFIREALQMYNAGEYPVWIISDTRQRSDLLWFKETYPGRCVTVRIVASEEVRISRGFAFTPGIDDAPTECDLDGVTDWNFVFENNSSEESQVAAFVDALLDLVRKS